MVSANSTHSHSVAKQAFTYHKATSRLAPAYSEGSLRHCGAAATAARDGEAARAAGCLGCIEPTRHDEKREPEDRS